MSNIMQNLILPSEEKGQDLLEKPDPRDDEWWKDRAKEDLEVQIESDASLTKASLLNETKGKRNDNHGSK